MKTITGFKALKKVLQRERITYDLCCLCHVTGEAALEAVNNNHPLARERFKAYNIAQRLLLEHQNSDKSLTK